MKILDLEYNAKMLVDQNEYLKSFKSIAKAINLKLKSNYRQDVIHDQVVEVAKLFN